LLASIAPLNNTGASQGDQRDAASCLLERVSTLQIAAAEAEATRRRLHNELVELRGNVRGVTLL
jgi:hypothetical protein